MERESLIVSVSCGEEGDGEGETIKAGTRPEGVRVTTCLCETRKVGQEGEKGGRKYFCLSCRSHGIYVCGPVGDLVVF